jgi:hypothetical protein
MEIRQIPQRLRRISMSTKRGLVFLFVLCWLSVCFAAAAASQSSPGVSKNPDPCTLLTKAEIQEVIGQPVGDGKLNTMANPSVGQPCEFKVGDYGVFSLLVKTAGPGENAGSAMAQLKKMGTSCTEVAGVGDGSFCFDAGYGMLSFNTFKGPKYLIITMLVPGMSMDAQRSCAEKLMRKVLSKI